jgi:hypothetical protein
MGDPEGPAYESNPVVIVKPRTIQVLSLQTCGALRHCHRVCELKLKACVHKEEPRSPIFVVLGARVYRLAGELNGYIWRTRALAHQDHTERS